MKCRTFFPTETSPSPSFFQRYFEHDSFEEIKKRAILLHVCVPGQEDGADEFPDDFVFPRLQVRPYTSLYPVSY